MRLKLNQFINIVFGLLVVFTCANLQAETIVTYQLHDAFGTPVVGTDDQGNVLWRRHYEPFGAELASEGDTTHTVTQSYTGHAYDYSLDLVNMGARFYDPQVGIFMGWDPAGVSYDNPYSFNRYAYANQNPYKYIDPDGRKAVLIGRNPGCTEGPCNNPLRKFGGGRSLRTKVSQQADGEVLSTSPPGGFSKHFSVTKGSGSVTKGAGGRSGKQARLKELANDPKLGKSERGWIKQERNSIARGNRKTIRNPPGKDLAHERGREAAKGYGYKYSNLQDRKLHRTQHKYDNFGRKNNERPPR